MSIVYDPSKLLEKVAPEAKIKRLLKGNISLKRTALTFVDSVDFLDKKSVSKVALKAIKSYKKRINEEPREKRAEAKSEILDDPRLLIHRVQNEVVTQITEEIKTAYEGEFYEWLPSDADEPDPEHQLNYGKVFRVGEGEMPGERYGCRCGMNILVKGSELELG